jgi:hypothetical protein
MKVVKSFLMVVVACIAMACSKPSEKIYLFNGENLAGWNSVLQEGEDGTEAVNVFSVVDGNIRIEGNPFGYMYTEQQFDNYRLHVEWRWVGEGSNSGIFQHVKYPDLIWPEAIECQLCAGKAGDLVMLGGSKIFDIRCVGEFPVKDRFGDNEKPVGEWNEAEIVSDGRQMKIYINGKLANECLSVSSRGHIALQSEGGPIEFRNIWLEKID